MAKKELENEVEEVSQEKVEETPRIAHDYHRQDLNDLRDAVNELFAQK